MSNSDHNNSESNGSYSDGSQSNDSESSESHSSYISYIPPPKTTSVPVNQIIKTDEILLGKQADIEIKKLQLELKHTGLYNIDYFIIWKQFESYNWVKPQVYKMAKDVSNVNEFLEKNAGTINQCPNDLLGESLGERTKVLCGFCKKEMDIWDSKDLTCNHYFCDSCWTKQIRANIIEGKLWSEFECLQNKCLKLMNFDFFKSLKLDQDVQHMNYYFKKIGQAIAKNSPTIISCKAKDCDKHIELPYELLNKDFRSKNDKISLREKELGYSINKEKYMPEDHFCSCYNIMCIGCEEMGHKPAKCEDANKWRENLDKNIRVIGNNKKCPGCSTQTEKNKGCDHVYCKQCKAYWCWICEGGAWKDYNHKCTGEDLVQKEKSYEALVKQPRVIFFLKHKHPSNTDLDYQGIHIIITNKLIDNCVEQKNHGDLLSKMIQALTIMENQFRHSEGHYRTQQKNLYKKFCLLDQDIGFTYQRNENLLNEMKVEPFETALISLKEKNLSFPDPINTTESMAINKNKDNILKIFNGSGIFEAQDMKWKCRVMMNKFDAINNNKDYEMQFEDVKLYKDGSVIGNGSDEYGKWTINGKLDQLKLTFVKQYIGKHIVNYNGNLTKEGVFIGTWKISHNNTGDFTIDIGFDNWEGYFKTNEKDISRLFVNVTPEGISGLGYDSLGVFIMKGNWDTKSNFCSFIKHYIGKHQSFFYGKMEKIYPWTFEGTFINEGKESDIFVLRRTLQKDKLKHLEKCIELYAQSDYSQQINIATALNTDFEKFKQRNEEQKTFNANILEEFLTTLKKAYKICIQVRSLITWTYPISFAMENINKWNEFNAERSILKGFLEELNFFIEAPKISAILYAIDKTLFEEQKNKLKDQKIKNALFTYEISEITEELNNLQLNNDFQITMIKALSQNTNSLEEKMNNATKIYQTDFWYKQAQINFTLASTIVDFTKVVVIQ